VPRGRKPDGDAALSNAERQARYRLRHRVAPTAAGRRGRLELVELAERLRRDFHDVAKRTTLGSDACNRVANFVG
jgi:hypothetical protein